MLLREHDDQERAWDRRVYYLLAAAGAKMKPEEVFPSLRASSDHAEQPETLDALEADDQFAAITAALAPFMQ